MWDNCSDLELLQGAGENLEAFGELIRRHQNFVFGAAMRVVRNRPIAEELTHEAFLRAFRARDSFRGDAGVRSWLYRIATNLAKNEVSRRREWPTDQDLDRVDHTDPGRRLHTEALTVDVRSAIEQLPDSLREPLVLREYEELSYAEISERTGVPLNTVRTRILRARRALRPHLEEWR
ncbi:MAG: sigma-70 family RNA polymerase sigma factor [Acidimicrobiia bacterium]|nr:sigma-70 family RNA polymerase sigma factor [Acidimicrobiia bacterium]